MNITKAAASVLSWLVAFLYSVLTAQLGTQPSVEPSSRVMLYIDVVCHAALKPLAVTPQPWYDMPVMQPSGAIHCMEQSEISHHSCAHLQQGLLQAASIIRQLD